MKAVCFQTVVFVYSMGVEKVQIHMSDTSHVTALSKNYSVLDFHWFCTQVETFKGSHTPVHLHSVKCSTLPPSSKQLIP
jgi:hypothetical protein